jgi:pimeloyl-ACP methyl ester carboxylesterase
MTIYRLEAGASGAIDLSVDAFGEGQPFLLLHGGGGPTTVAEFAQTFAASRHARVIVPVHPGFGGTTRPEGFHTIHQLAALYISLLEELDANDVTVIGNSMGGWIASEIALLDSPRVRRVVLVDAVGIEVPDHPIADFFSLSLSEVFALSYFDPKPFLFDPTALAPAIQAIQAGNRASLAAYAGASMNDKGLEGRLATVKVPVLVVWGDSDRIVDPDYGRAFAAAIPSAQFELLHETGHLPQLETPDKLDAAIWSFSSGDADPAGAGS